MLRKSALLKAALSSQVEVNTVKDYDIIKLYQKHHKEGSEKQRKILEIQRRAVRNGINPQRQRVPPRRVRVAERTFLPQIVTNVSHATALDNSPRDGDGNVGNEGKNGNDTKIHDVHLPHIRVEKGRSRRRDGHEKTGNELRDGNDGTTQDAEASKDRYAQSRIGNAGENDYDGKTQIVANTKDTHRHGYDKSGNEGPDGHEIKTKWNLNESYSYGKTENDSKDVNYAQMQNKHLPRIALDKRKCKGKTVDDHERQPVYDPRFRSLLSSLIDLPQQFGQIQCYAPSIRLSYATMQKQK